jgi:hypothetical protein
MPALTTMSQEFLCHAAASRVLSYQNILIFYHIRPLVIGLISPWMENVNVVEFLKENSITDCVRLVS